MEEEREGELPASSCPAPFGHPLLTGTHGAEGHQPGFSVLVFFALPAVPPHAPPGSGVNYGLGIALGCTAYRWERCGSLCQGR